MSASGMLLQLDLELALLKGALQHIPVQEGTQTPCSLDISLELRLSRPAQLSQCFISSQGIRSPFGKSQGNYQGGFSHTRNTCVLHYHSVLR